MYAVHIETSEQAYQLRDMLHKEKIISRRSFLGILVNAPIYKSMKNLAGGWIIIQACQGKVFISYRSDRARNIIGATLHAAEYDFPTFQFFWPHLKDNLRFNGNK